MSNVKEQDQQEIVISYLTLRKLLGLLGMVLPLIMMGGTVCMHCHLQGSISAYYYSPMRDWFVGILWAMGVFFVSYTGYKEDPHIKLTENLLTNLAGFLAVLIALLPTMGDAAVSQSCTTHSCPIPSFANVFGKNLDCQNTWVYAAHLISALLFFIVLAYMLCFKFVNILDPSNRQKEIKFYRAMGIVMFVSIGVMLANAIADECFKERYPLHNTAVLFFLETIALWAFGLAWLIKGKIHEDILNWWNRWKAYRAR